MEIWQITEGFVIARERSDRETSVDLARLVLAKSARRNERPRRDPSRFVSKGAYVAA